MDFIFSIISLVIGYFIGAFSLSQIIIVLFFSIPFTKKLLNNAIVSKTSPIIRGGIATIIIHTIIITIVSMVFLILFREYVLAYLIGILITLILGARFYTATLDNIREYFKNYYQFIDDNLFIEYIEREYNFENSKKD